MTVPKSSTQEPFLNSVARKLGHAAGTLTNVAQEFTESLSALPQTVSTSIRQVAEKTKATPRSKRKIRRPARKRTQTATIAKRKAAKKLSPSRRTTKNKGTTNKKKKR